MHPVAIIILALAAYRIARLIVTDTIADRPRNWLFTHGPVWLSELLNCMHCTGFWVGLAVAGAYLAAPVVVPKVLLPFALAGVVSLLAEHDGR